MQGRAARLSCDRSLKVVHADDVSPGELVNISITGARLKNLGRMRANTLVILCAVKARIPARVVWSTDTQIGVRFAIPLSVSDVDAICSVDGRHRLPASQPATNSPVDRHLI